MSALRSWIRRAGPLVVVAGLVFLSTAWAEADPPAPTSEPEAEPAPAPRGFALERTIARRHDGETYRLFRWRVPLADVHIGIEDVQMRRSFRALLHGADLVINGGFYDPQRRAEGLVVVDSEERVPFDERIGGGVLAVSNGVATLHDAEAPLALPTSLDFAIQCRPRLVVDSQNNIARGTPPTAARTALCIRDAGRTLDVIVARRFPSRGRAGPRLYDLAALLVADGCEQALNLDGGPSTGVAWRDGDRFRQMRPERGVRHAITFSR
ncbi:MAG: phosphodiester glycosidase family protein [Sandaracinaceae bacterium]